MFLPELVWKAIWLRILLPFYLKRWSACCLSIHHHRFYQLRTQQIDRFHWASSSSWNLSKSLYFWKLIFQLDQCRFEIHQTIPGQFEVFPNPVFYRWLRWLLQRNKRFVRWCRWWRFSSWKLLVRDRWSSSSWCRNLRLHQCFQAREWYFRQTCSKLESQLSSKVR